MEESAAELVLLDEDCDLDFSLPLNRIRKICRLDPDLTSISLDAVKAITLATEKFIQLLAQSAHEYARDESRKTVQVKDVERSVKEDWLFAMLEDAIADWPGDFVPASANPSAAANTEEAEKQEDEVECADASVEVLPVEEVTADDVGMVEESSYSIVVRDIEDI